MLPRVPERREDDHGEVRIERWDAPSAVRKLFRKRRPYRGPAWLLATIVFVYLTDRLSTYGQPRHETFGLMLVIAAVFVLGVLVNRATTLSAWAVSVGPAMSQLLSLGYGAWDRLPADDRERTNQLMRVMTAAAERHDLPAVVQRVAAVRNLDEINIVAQRNGAGTTDIEDVEALVRARRDIQGGPHA